ncbi:MAG TPA: hypothetical protein VM870_04605, partial [Pyrinomonadaceae bacterium]|nr:hypothetical protein [Pyrinomonadaceae bacterium]
SEFFTQDVEDLAIPSVEAVEEVAPTAAPAPFARNSHFATAAPTNTAVQQPFAERSAPEARPVDEAGGGLMAEHARLTKDILAACHGLGKTEAQLSDWIKKKYQVDDMESLTAFHKREVLAFLQSRLTSTPAS